MLARFVLFLKGFCMGIADVIPGVSGGTMALILGIYERLVDAIRSVDLGMVRAVFTGDFWRRFFSGLLRPDSVRDDAEGTEGHASRAAFLAVLLLGIVAAALTGVKIIPGLMADYRAPTLGFFFGLVLASVVVPYRLMGRRGPAEIAAFALTVTATFFVVGLQTDDSSNAQGAVTVRLAEGVTTEGRLPVVDTQFAALPEDGNEKRKVVFVPTQREGEIVVPPGANGVQVPVVAQMGGSDANLPAGAVTRLVSPAGVDVVVTQPAPLTGGSDPALWWLFLCGAIAICAMILPGISGSFILLLLGQYFYVIHVVHEIVYARDWGRLPVLAVFLGGIVVGILAFSRLLSWLLHHYHSTVMAVLVGLMLGSLRKLWPFDGAPTSVDGTVLTTAATFVVGIVIVLGLNWLGQRREQTA